MPADFSLAALGAALDAQRLASGLTWSQVAREIDALGPGARAMSASTIAGLRTRTAAEADGVLQMLRWLDRAPESFVPGHDGPEARLPAVAPGRILRLDATRLHSALDAQRAARGLAWAQLARDLGLAAASLTRLGSGGRSAFPQVMRLTGWLSRPLAEFTSAADR